MANQNSKKDRIIELSNIILDFLLDYKNRNPDFTFSLRKRDSSQSQEKRLENGQWFQGSDYIYVPLFKKGDSARKIKTIGFGIFLDKDGGIKQNSLAISFKKGITSEKEKQFHRELAEKIDLKLNNKNHGSKPYDNPDDYLYNLRDYIENIRPLALELLKKYQISQGYLISDAEFNNSLKTVKQIRNKLEADKKELNRITVSRRKMKSHLNQILYGPPGTGKTYNTINKALEIIGVELEGKTRSEIKEIFDAKMQEGQIVFTTFHQSMSYEDFIEGIKPLEPKKDGEPVIYKVLPGILKELCKRIKDSEKLTQGNSPVDAPINFDRLYSAFINRLKEIISELEENETHFFESRKSKIKFLGIDKNSILTVGETANSNERITKDKLERIYKAFETPNEIKNIPKQLREVGTDISWTTNYFAVFKALKEFEASIKARDAKNVVAVEKQNYVLIIDEINRGNVSQIFGELITLIEEDKRLSKVEALEATLPYSKEKFGIPSNLYIIGTMNTADRSVEALDAALRRRFSFQEMPPNPQIIKTEGKLKESDGVLEGIDLGYLLETINRRVEKLLDKDHQIGHSYFMTVSNLEDLKSAFQSKVIPLLQEYFFGDYGKIGLVLGAQFFRPIEKNEANLFADFDDYDDTEFTERMVYKIKDVLQMSDDEFIQAINALLKK